MKAGDVVLVAPGLSHASINLKSSFTQFFQLVNDQCLFCDRIVMNAEIGKHTVLHLDKCGTCFNIKNETHECDKIQCYVCDLQFTNQSHLKAHIISHDINNNYKDCVICGIKFKKSVSLKEHLKCCHNIKNFDFYINRVEKCEEVINCKFCKQSCNIFNINDHLMSHCFNCAFCNSIAITNFHICREYICVICDEKFDTLKKFRCHSHEGVRNVDRICFICNKLLSHFIVLKNHLNVTHDIQHFCMQCKRSFKTENMKMLHQACTHQVFVDSFEKITYNVSKEYCVNEDIDVVAKYLYKLCPNLQISATDAAILVN